ncbi:MAG: phosphate acyltransferase PlsX [Acidobacteriota bacterium]|nr:phosphate acyltransferase PlsX [Acidobacteriota bacterium]MDH3522925.1 phosphate acyltransferase PlsX [Acidobacteriota bacterium]
MLIAVDAMGGDHAPEAVVAGAVRAAHEDGTGILLVGDRDRIANELARLEPAETIEVVHATEVVDMAEPAVAPLRRKRDSSIRLCGDLVRAGRAQAMVTAGNTGAATIVAKVVVGTIKGVDRPALAGVFPNPRARTVVLDVGANVDSKPQQLREFAVMGHFYAQEVIHTPSPRVGLLSIGAEEGKGDDVTRRVFEVMKTTGLNFVGNVEGSDVFGGEVDVIVCDGFVGNAILKSAESLVEFVAATLRTELGRSWRTRMGAALAAPAFRALRRHIDYTEYGAAPLLGVNGGCFIAHGRSNPKAVQSAIRRAVEFCEADLAGKIRDKVAELHAQEELLLRPPGPRETRAS